MPQRDPDALEGFGGNGAPEIPEPQPEGQGPTIDIQQLLAKIGEDTIIKQMMAQDIQRLMAENQALKERLEILEGSYEPERVRKSPARGKKSA